MRAERRVNVGWVSLTCQHSCQTVEHMPGQVRETQSQMLPPTCPPHCQSFFHHYRRRRKVLWLLPGGETRGGEGKKILQRIHKERLGHHRLTIHVLRGHPHLSHGLKPVILRRVIWCHGNQGPGFPGEDNRQ